MEQKILTELAQFIAFRTVAPDNDAKRACLSWVAKTFLGDGQSIVRGESEGVPYLLLEHPHPRLLWFAHIDVVPGSGALFTLRQDGDRVLGRGVKDMKGSALPFLTAYREAVAAGRQPPVSILLTSDEELGGMSIRSLVEQRIAHGPVAFTPDTGEEIVVAHKGAMWIWLIAEGRGTHGAYPWNGDNPVPRLADAVAKLAAVFPSPSKEAWALTVTPTMLEGGSAKNVVPDRASCLLDVRYPPEKFSSPDAVLDRLKAVLPPRCRLEILITTPPLATDPNHPAVVQFSQIARDVLGHDVPVTREHGASDARYFSVKGIPAFLCGPRGGAIHTEHEWVSLESMLQHTEISRRWLAEL